MKQFTQYLYEYRQEKKVRNIGFVKVEQKGEVCFLQMQGRGFAADSGELKVYLFYKTDAGYEAAYQGRIPKKNPIVNFTLEFTADDIGNAGALEEIAGIMLSESGGSRYAAVWNGEKVDVDAILTEIKAPETPIAASEKESEASVAPSEEEPEAVLQVQVEEERNSCEKIQRKDLARLPRREWRLANNNFLLHGFYNYHHLLWIEEDGELYIGVPGVNHAREIQAAQVFGFTQFRNFENMDLQLSEDEMNPGDDFGYFCRRIKRTNEPG